MRETVLSEDEPETPEDPTTTPRTDKPDITSAPSLNIYCIGAAPLLTLAKRPDHEIFAVTLADIDKALAPKTETDPSTKVLSEYHDLLYVFSRSDSEKLLQRRLYDHKI